MQLQVSFSLFLILIFCSEETKEAQRFLPPECTLPKKKGECQGMFMRWYYDSKTNRCEWFHYKGCRGNDNNFLSRYQCQAVCMNT
ncbi:kunitz-type protease inhibitor 3 [Apodemus sylvaticus]|uniref:kunitz-type protease inhibitor 3 n=1 Tax=Apodemus sylvaticus TaxID=10129 RepID=UPI002243F7FB|nr:kunitz-type protease inhibitor 3 [Apodemus sylvaticus]